jgi:lysophospholipase L1-like esterase
MRFFFFLILLLPLAALAQRSPIMVYLAGDSTLAGKALNKRPETGWGENLQQYFDDQKVKVENHAQNGRSTKSFIDEGRWQKIVDALKPGDYVFIQFGHNDQKSEDPKRYGEANGGYRDNLIRFVGDVRAKEANPVLLTPVMRRRFNEKGEFYDTHGDYPDAVRRVAGELKVPLIDMHRKSAALLIKFGEAESKKLFLQLAPNEHPNYPKGVEDNTHFSVFGAEQIARLAVEGMKETKIGLAELLIKD